MITLMKSLQRLARTCNFEDLFAIILQLRKSRALSANFLYPFIQQIFIYEQNFALYCRNFEISSVYFTIDDRRKFLRCYEFVLAGLCWGNYNEIINFSAKTPIYVRRSKEEKLSNKDLMITLTNLYIALAFLPRALETGFGIDSVIFRLASLSSLYQYGLPADIFLVPCIKLLIAKNDYEEAYKLLTEYSENLPENPNTHKYMHEFLAKLQPEEIQELICQSDIKLVREDGTKTDLLDSESLLQSLSLILKNRDLVLYHKLLYSLKMLPEPCPAANPQDAYSCPTNFHLPVVRQLITQNYAFLAIYLLFQLLDHPSWGHYHYIWKVFHTTLDQQIHSYHIQIKQMWQMRSFWWKKQYQSEETFTSPMLRQVLTLLDADQCKIKTSKDDCFV